MIFVTEFVIWAKNFPHEGSSNGIGKFLSPSFVGQNVNFRFRFHFDHINDVLITPILYVIEYCVDF